VVKTKNSPRRTQRNTEKKTSVPLCALCGKNNKFTTESAEKHKEQKPPSLSAPSVVKQKIHHGERRETQR
jgi:hypothetical protein